MIQDFSRAYYKASMDVQEYEDGPVIEKGLYNFINRELYTDSTVPVRMRLGLDAGETFQVGAENAIPRDVLALPQELHSGEPSGVFVLKSDYYYG